MQRETYLSNTLISVLYGIAIKEVAVNIKDILMTWKFAFSPNLVEFLSLPYVSAITLARFLVGNFLHMKDIEEKSLKVAQLKVWPYDLLWISVEGTLFILLGTFSYPKSTTFFPLLGLLLGVDVIWVVGMLIPWPNSISYRLRKKANLKIPWPWTLINFLSILYLWLLLGGFYPFSSVEFSGLCHVCLIFTVAAILDFGYDIYNVLYESFTTKRKMALLIGLGIFCLFMFTPLLQP